MSPGGILMRYLATLALFSLVLLECAWGGAADEAEARSAIDVELIKYVDGMRAELVSANQDIWNFAEVGLEEHRSAARLAGMLRKAGFKVEEGVAGMPTAFVA